MAAEARTVRKVTKDLPKLTVCHDAGLEWESGNLKASREWAENQRAGR